MNGDETTHIEQLKQGNTTSFASLYNRYAPQLFGYALQLTHSRSSAEELVQDTFLKVWYNRAEIDSNLSFKSFLFKIAKNHLIDQIRKRLRDPLFEEYLLSDTNAELSYNPIQDKTDFDDFCFRLRQVKERMTQRQREIFELHREQGYSATEIAKKLEITERTVFNQLHLATKLVRETMQKNQICWLLLILLV